MYRSVEEIEKALQDRGRAEAVMARVNKGGKGSFTYIPWNDTVRLLDDVFGVFGWTARVTHTANDFERGIYRTDIELTVLAEAENGAVLTKTLPGTGVGIVVGQSQDAHDTAIKASRSDAISVAAKSLGNAFGLFLYDKGDPARSEGASQQTTRQASSSSTPTVNKAPAGGPRPSEKQMTYLLKHYTQGTVDGMEFKTWKACLDAIFGKKDLPVPSDLGTPNKEAPVKVTAAKAPSPKPVKAEEIELVEEMPW